MKANWKQGLLVIASIGLLFSFQNCGQTGAGDSSDASIEQQVHVDPRYSALKFPYRLVANQFAYMSCGNGNLANFTFKIGAFTDSDTSFSFASTGVALPPGGVVLKTEFLTAFDAATAGMSADEKQSRMRDALMTISPSYGMQPFFSVRAPTNSGSLADPSAILVQTDAGNDANYDFPLGVLSNTEYADPVSQNRNKFQNYFPAAPYERRNFESKITFKYNASWADEEAFISNVGQGGLLLGFADPKKIKVDKEFPTIEVARPPGSSDRSAHGQYLLPVFRHQLANNKNPDTANPPLFSNRRVTDIEEQNLDEGTSPISITDVANWKCKQFMVVQAGDRNSMIYKHNTSTNSTCGVTASGTNCVPTAACPIETYSQLYPIPPNPENLAWNQAMRRFLPVEEWDVNITGECIVPKKSANGCYGGGAVVYDQVFFPGTAMAAIGGHAGCGGTYGNCAHYLSLCIRRGPTPR